MKTIVTSREKTYPVDYCGVGYLGMVKMQIKDSRLLGEIAPEMEGLEWIELTDDRNPEQPETECFEGYTVLKRLEWADENSVIVLLGKEEQDGDGEV